MKNGTIFKRLAALVLTLAMALSLTACGKSEEAKAAEALIDAIGEVTLESEEAISAAEDAYAALTEEDQKAVDPAKLESARGTYDQLVLQAQADEVIAAIDAIGTVTEDSAGAVDEAREMYDGCASDVQALVTNLATLEETEKTLSDLRARAVSDLIDAIGEVSMDSAGKIDEAQAAYDALSAEDQARVANAGTLTAAAEKLAEVKKAAAQQLLSGFKKEEDKVRGMRFYYPSAFPYYTDYWATDKRCFALPYLGQNSDSTWMRFICDYTGDDWIFFDHITFAVDDERYTKSFNYFDITRDNAYGDVWEYVDVDVSEGNYEEILSAIADSTETIVRFEGDDYHYDLTVSAADKQAIRDTLAVYQALK